MDKVQKTNHFEDKSEMISEDLKKEIERYFREVKWIYLPFVEVARHFADWQHGKDFDDLLQSEMKFPKEYYERGKADAMKEMKEALQTEYEKGRFDMRAEMMKDAVDAFVNTYENTDVVNYVEFVTEQSPYKFKETDKVKIIIVKEQ